MKTKFTEIFKYCIMLWSILLLTSVSAQVSEKGFSFQGYARDFDGNAIGGTNVYVKFTIYPEGASSSPDFTETHELTTDAFGVFTTIVGSVNEAIFYSLDWMNNNYYLKTEVSSNNSDFVTVSETQLLSVPYAQVAANGVPSGTILPFGGGVTTVPPGYLVCDGREVNIADYPLLFAAIGTAWGGNGSSTFRLPDLRGQFLRGVDSGQGVDPEADSRTALNGGNTGDAVGSYQDGATKRPNTDFTTDESGEHTHEVPKSKVGNTEPGRTEIIRGPYTDISNTTTTLSAGNHSHTITGGGDTETRPKNAYVWYIIKY